MTRFGNCGKELRAKIAGGLAAFAVLVIFSGFFAHKAAGQSTAKPAQAAAPDKKQSAVAPQPMPEAGQETFASAQVASQALVAALQKNDTPGLLKILGSDAKDILSAGDETQDREDRQQFVEKYKEMHRLLTEPDGLTTLYIGAENWPAPIPLAHDGNRWFFDTAAGREEILYRRIGRNEMTVIQLCGELVDAEHEYYASPHDGQPVHQYAQKITSDPGKHDGLYWPVTSGAAQSPLGPLVAAAEQPGDHKHPGHRVQPFHGYYFRVLKAQGPGAKGGAMDYVANGRMTRGFAFVAYPAEYRSSGVMTFLINMRGVVYQKDLGPKTARIAKSMKKYDRDATWTRAE